MDLDMLLYEGNEKRYYMGWNRDQMICFKLLLILDSIEFSHTELP